MASKPLQRSIAKLKKDGYHHAIVERYIPFPKPWGHRVDMYGLIDVVGIRAEVLGVLGVQACAACDLSKHRDKALSEPMFTCLRIWKANGNRFVIWAWGKRGPRGKAKKWECKEVEL